MQKSLNGTSGFDSRPSVTPISKADLRYLQISHRGVGVFTSVAWQRQEGIDYLLSLNVDDK